ncbi:ectomycorrhiza-regulated esterase [Trametes cingulata]|nr:ectomycorrhiza-regulated esterase [Trametes cingulata]
MTVMAPITTQKTTKLQIPHTYEKDCAITGVLEQVAPEQPTQGRRIALILHGSLGQDYLFQKRLAHRLPLDSFRFDFRGNHETPGPMLFGKFENDVVDLDVVVEYLTKEFGYVIDMLVGHSRGSVVGLLWLCKHRDGASKNVRRYVNVSGRYRMENDPLVDLEKNKEEMERQGYITRTATVARKPYVGKVYREDYDEFARVNTAIAWDQFPQHIDVLTLHGLKDEIVPPYDAFIYARIYGARNPGTHLLRYVEEADHNFTGMPEEVVDTVLEWLQQQERNELKTGVWHTGVKGKL